jgi:hypothetical protein
MFRNSRTGGKPVATHQPTRNAARITCMRNSE